MREDLRKHISCCFLVLGYFFISAQQGTLLTHYYDLQSFYNTAVAGNDDYLKIGIDGRDQWIGIQDHPLNFSFVAGMPVRIINTHLLGAGIQGYYNHAGPYDYSIINAQISYKIKVSAGILSLGIQPGYALMKSSKTPDLVSPNDNENITTNTTKRSKGSFNFGAAIYFSNKYGWIGFSANNLLSPKMRIYTDNNTEIVDKDNRRYIDLMRISPQYILMGGYNLIIKGVSWSFRPSFIASYSNKYYDGEITGIAQWKNLIYGGLGYRWKDAVSLIAGVEIKGFEISYSYDLPCGLRSRGSSGSHEISLIYKMKVNILDPSRHGYKSIRYI